MRIGLFGGSFNPPHAGHRLVALQALRRLQLDMVWILVSPGNLLKDRSQLAPLPQRVAAAREVFDHPRIRVTGWEAARGFHYTADTVALLKETLPGRKLVWIMGADSLTSFHRWQRWQWIARSIPIAVYARPGVSTAIIGSPMVQRFGRYRLDEADAPLLASTPAPAWVFLHGHTSPLSSSALRRALRKQ